WRSSIACVLVSSVASRAGAQTPLTWAEVRDRFRAANPTLQAGQIGIDESKADEITAFLRPNPQYSFTLDQVGNTIGGNPFSASTVFSTFSYLQERQDKRELRRDSAEGATAIATSTQADLERNLIFTLRAAFVQVLQAKAFRTLAQDNLTNYDQVLSLSRSRFQAGDITQIGLDRLLMRRV